MRKLGLNKKLRLKKMGLSCTRAWPPPRPPCQPANHYLPDNLYLHQRQHGHQLRDDLPSDLVLHLVHCLATNNRLQQNGDPRGPTGTNRLEISKCVSD